jgi:hypothetical protein
MCALYVILVKFQVKADHIVDLDISRMDPCPGVQRLGEGEGEEVGVGDGLTAS